MRLPVFYALKRIAYYDISPVSYYNIGKGEDTV